MDPAHCPGPGLSSWEHRPGGSSGWIHHIIPSPSPTPSPPEKNKQEVTLSILHSRLPELKSNICTLSKAYKPELLTGKKKKRKLRCKESQCGRLWPQRSSQERAFDLNNHTAQLRERGEQERAAVYRTRFLAPLRRPAQKINGAFPLWAVHGSPGAGGGSGAGGGECEDGWGRRASEHQLPSATLRELKQEVLGCFTPAWLPSC